MPELRRNPLTDTWVIIAPERQYRPSEQECRPHTEPSRCPFCPGHESMATSALLTMPDQKGGWKLRVVPNRYPALRVEEADSGTTVGVHDQRGGLGAHEVIIDSPSHDEPVTVEESAALHARSLVAAAERMRDLSGDLRLRYHLYFRNVGADAGSTLVHPHAQLLSMAILPPAVRRELERNRDHHDRTGRLLMGDMLRDELTRGSGIVHEDADFVVFCPWASRRPFETWVAPRRHPGSFARTSSSSIGDFGSMIGQTAMALRLALPGVGWNLSLHLSGAQHEDPLWWWHARLVPTVGIPGALESATGVFINAEDPSNAADYLRRTWGRDASAHPLAAQ
jgi:UDPglucose--hexose-1-phosphate uridylyltransferase